MCSDVDIVQVHAEMSEVILDCLVSLLSRFHNIVSNCHCAYDIIGLKIHYIKYILYIMLPPLGGFQAVRPSIHASM